MRYRTAHAAVDGSSPSPRRVPKSVRVVLSGLFAAAIGLVPAIFIASPFIKRHAYGNSISLVASVDMHTKVQTMHRRISQYVATTPSA